MMTGISAWYLGQVALVLVLLLNLRRLAGTTEANEAAKLCYSQIRGRRIEATANLIEESQRLSSYSQGHGPEGQPAKFLSQFWRQLETLSSTADFVRTAHKKNRVWSGIAFSSFGLAMASTLIAGLFNLSEMEVSYFDQLKSDVVFGACGAALVVIALVSAWYAHSFVGHLVDRSLMPDLLES